MGVERNKMMGSMIKLCVNLFLKLWYHNMLENQKAFVHPWFSHPISYYTLTYIKGSQILWSYVPRCNVWEINGKGYLCLKSLHGTYKLHLTYLGN